MTTIFETIIYSIAAGSLFLLLLTTLAAPHKVNLYANRWLALFLFSFGCILLDRVFMDTNIYETYPFVTGILEITRFAMSPALYFSVLYFTMPDRKRKATDYIHFIPAALFLLFIITTVAGINDSPLFSWFHDLPVAVKRGVAITMFVTVKLQMIVYWVLSYIQLSRHTKNIKVFASTTKPVSLWWLRNFLLGLSVALLLSLNETTAAIPAIIPLTHFGYLFLVFYLAYFSIRQQEIYPYRSNDVAEIHEIFIESSSRQPQQKRFSDEDLATWKHKLLQLMKTEKVFLDPNLGLPQLASQLKLSTHDLSYLINEGFKENFFQFINRFRIEEAKVLLVSDRHKHLNILGIAYESGFRSKSTFNATFKKLTGISPSEYSQSPKDISEKREKAA
jgi:AraC-like DNA-binding protein